MRVNDHAAQRFRTYFLGDGSRMRLRAKRRASPILVIAEYSFFGAPSHGGGRRGLSGLSRSAGYGQPDANSRRHMCGRTLNVAAGQCNESKFAVECSHYAECRRAAGRINKFDVKRALLLLFLKSDARHRVQNKRLFVIQKRDWGTTPSPQSHLRFRVVSLSRECCVRVVGRYAALGAVLEPRRHGGSALLRALPAAARQYAVMTGTSHQPCRRIDRLTVRCSPGAVCCTAGDRNGCSQDSYTHAECLHGSDPLLQKCAI